MAQGTRIYDVVLMALVLYSVFIYTESSDTTTLPCSWGSWQPWDCSCCGASIDNTVYRVRAHCCEETVCTQLRVDAVTVTSIGTNYQQHGTCDKNCHSQFASRHGNMCFPKMPTLEEIAWPNKRNSCLSVCLDIINTTPATTTATAPHQPNINKTISGEPAPTVDLNISSTTVQATSEGNTDRPTTTLSVSSIKVATGISEGNGTHVNGEQIKVTTGISEGNGTHGNGEHSKITTGISEGNGTHGNGEHSKVTTDINEGNGTHGNGEHSKVTTGLGGGNGTPGNNEYSHIRLFCCYVILKCISLF